MAIFADLNIAIYGNLTKKMLIFPKVYGKLPEGICIQLVYNSISSRQHG